MTFYMWILLFGALVITKAQDFNLGDALLDDEPTAKPETKKPVVPAKDGGDLSDDDLAFASDGHKPDPGKGDRSGGVDDFGGVTDDRDDETKAAQGGQMAGIISAVAVAIFGAASSYFAYQKKKLCFKGQGGTDLESGGNQPGTQSDPQASRNLLRIS
ncbi:CD99 molecule isoform X2 [Silurus meridionalis]|uniref:CD99 molecule isoform X2 n=1 Tax=Silurus meridionalis TaxID=175797 RepID=UPI001EEA7E70|nr:CD99 molecule isoform X2 [Silurus meridionalis]